MSHISLFIIAAVFCLPVLHAQEQRTALFRSELLDPIVRPVHSSHYSFAVKGMEESRTGLKSGFLAVMYSLLLPGMGELYSGRFDAGMYPLIAEGALWTGFGGLQLYSSWVRSDALTFANAHAAANAEGKDDRYLGALGNYRSVREHNAAKLIERNLAALYPEDPAAGFAWSWDNDEQRTQFKDLRISADEISNTASFVALALVANRIWSAVQAAILVKKHNAGLKTDAGFIRDIRSEVTMYNGAADGIRFRLVGRF